MPDASQPKAAQPILFTYMTMLNKYLSVMGMMAEIFN